MHLLETPTGMLRKIVIEDRVNLNEIRLCSFFRAVFAVICAVFHFSIDISFHSTHCVSNYNCSEYRLSVKTKSNYTMHYFKPEIKHEKEFFRLVIIHSYDVSS